MRFSISIPAALFLSALSHGAAAQETVPFAGGVFTIVERDDALKVLAFDGEELARNYFVFFTGTHEVAGTEVALFEVGEGGNACGPNTLIVWKPEGGAIETAQAGDDCGSPSASIGPYAIHFVPYLLPGESLPVHEWTPEEGLKVAGNLSFSPQPGTSWATVSVPGHMMSVFGNASVYDTSRAMLGDELTEVARGLSVGSAPKTLDHGVFWSRGCVPHACGLSDSFMAVDVARQRLYFAQQQDGDPRSWPEAAHWPEDVRAAMAGALGR